MDRNLMRTVDALEDIESLNKGLDCLLSLLFHSRDDAPSGEKIAELLQPLQRQLALAIAEAKEGLKS